MTQCTCANQGMIVGTQFPPPSFLGTELNLPSSHPNRLFLPRHLSGPWFLIFFFKWPSSGLHYFQLISFKYETTLRIEKFRTVR